MGGCTNCKGKSGCDDRKGAMLEQVADALDRLYPTRTWGELAAGASSGGFGDDDWGLAPTPEAPGATAASDVAALADELASELDAATFVAAGDACDYIYVLCMGRPPCAVQVRDHGVPAPAEWDGATGGGGAISELYLRVCVSRVARMAAVQEVALDVTAAPGGWVMRERPHAGVYGAPLLRRMQRLVAILPAYELVHLDFGEISAPPDGFAAGVWRERFGGAPATANYLFFPEPATMVSTSWLPREAGAQAS